MSLSPTQIEQLARFRGKLAARTNSDDKPKPGFKANVAELNRRISELEKLA